MSKRKDQLRVADGLIFREGKYIDKVDWEKNRPKVVKKQPDNTMILPSNKS